MTTQFMLNIMGDDRAHLIKDLSGVTHELGGKWLNSRFTRLEGQLVGIIKVELAEEHKEALVSGFKAAGDFDVRVSPIKSGDAAQLKQLSLKIEAADQPGLVNRISQVISDEGGAIAHMENHRVSVPELGTLVFTAALELEIPEELEAENLIDQIKELDEQLVVEAI